MKMDGVQVILLDHFHISKCRSSSPSAASPGLVFDTPLISPDEKVIFLRLDKIHIYALRKICSISNTATMIKDGIMFQAIYYLYIMR